MKKNENIENCKLIFVTWAWLAAILIILTVSIGGVTYGIGTKTATMEHKLKEVENDIKSLQRIEQKIDILVSKAIRPEKSRIDTLLERRE